MCSVLKVKGVYVFNVTSGNYKLIAADICLNCFATCKLYMNLCVCKRTRDTGENPSMEQCFKKEGKKIKKMCLFFFNT